MILSLILSPAWAGDPSGPDSNDPRLDVKRGLHSTYYRGQTMDVFIKCLREPWRKKGSTPRSRWVSYCGYKILDPSGKVIRETAADRLAPFSGVTVDWRIPADAVLGSYRLIAELRGPGIAGGGNALSWPFRVAGRAASIAPFDGETGKDAPAL